MGNVQFSQTTQTPEQRLLFLALEGDFDAFIEVIATERLNPKSIEIFDAVAYDMGLPEKHYLLFELAKRGEAALFETCVRDYNFSLTIFEDEKARMLEVYQGGKRFEEKLNLPVLRDASLEHHITRSAYYSTLPEFVRECTFKFRKELRELMAQWLTLHREIRKLGPEQRVDDSALSEYSQTQLEWVMDMPYIVMSEESFAAERRAHQRRRPRVVPLFEKEKRRRLLCAGTLVHKKNAAELLRKYRGLQAIAVFISKHQIVQSA